MKCNAKKGTCTEARDFVTCTTKGAVAVPGVCFAGICNPQISLPVVKAAGRCQTYNCPVNGVCSVVSQPDGADCTPNNVAYESICLQGVCKRVWEGLGETFPLQNIGCIGKPNGEVCDTNHLLVDGETCQNNVCIKPDGTFYGYLP